MSDSTARWILIGAVGLFSAGGLWVLGVAVTLGSLLPQLEFAILLLAFVAVCRVVGPRVPLLARPMAVVGDLLLSLLQVLAALIVFLPLTYLAAAPDFPLIDAVLAHLDRLLFGFEWHAAARWVAEHPAIDRTLRGAYFSVLYQAAAILVIGSIDKPGDRNGALIWQFAISLILTCAIFVFTPALGFGTAYLETLTAIRGGTLTVLDYANAEGIVTFPSFHTTLAILFVHAARRHPWALAGFVPLNLLLIAATPTVGGHYLMDLPAGAIVAVAAIAATHILRRRLNRTITENSI